MLELLRRGDWQKVLADINFATVRRVGAWASAAMIALVALIFTAETDTGSNRLTQTFTAKPDPASTMPVVAQIPARQPELERLNQRLTDTIKALSADRERLNKRIAILELNIEDVTGSIKKSADAVPDKIPEKTTTPAVPPPMLVFSAVPMLPEGSPAVWPGTQPASSHATSPNIAAATPPLAARAEMPPVPLPPVAPVRTASVIDEPAAEPPVPPSALGLDLGGARSIDALTIHWATMKAKFGPLLHNLHPVVSIRERKPGVPELRLIAGPMQSPDAVTQACMTIVAARAPCRPAVFAGQQLMQR